MRIIEYACLFRNIIASNKEERSFVNEKKFICYPNVMKAHLIREILGPIASTKARLIEN